MSPGRTSLTARVVALGRAIGVEGQRDPLAEAFLPPAERVVADVARRLRALPGGRQAVSLALAGVERHATLRSVAVDRAVDRAVARGCRQAVVLGAGYDTRAWRLEALRGLPCIEVDRPATQADKRRRVAGLTPLADVRFAAADLGVDDLGVVLADAGHEPDVPTVWVWEAVVPYLPDADVRATAARITEHSAPGSTLAVTFVAPLPLPGPVRGLAHTAVGAGFGVIGEPVRCWLEEWDAADLLVRAGLAEPVITGPAEWAATAGLDVGRSPFGVERLAVAHRP